MMCRLVTSLALLSLARGIQLLHPADSLAKTKANSEINQMLKEFLDVKGDAAVKLRQGPDAGVSAEMVPTLAPEDLEMPDKLRKTFNKVLDFRPANEGVATLKKAVKDVFCTRYKHEPRCQSVAAQAPPAAASTGAGKGAGGGGGDGIPGQKYEFGFPGDEEVAKIEQEKKASAPIRKQIDKAKGVGEQQPTSPVELK